MPCFELGNTPFYENLCSTQINTSFYKKLYIESDICISLDINVHCLLQGLHHMWLWISLMTQRESPRAVSRKVAEQNAKTVTRNYSNRSSSVAR